MILYTANDYIKFLPSLCTGVKYEFALGLFLERVSFENHFSAFMREISFVACSVSKVVCGLEVPFLRGKSMMEYCLEEAALMSHVRAGIRKHFTLTFLKERRILVILAMQVPQKSALFPWTSTLNGFYTYSIGQKHVKKTTTR